MAIVFDATIGGKRYQVRHAGSSVRLYTDGAFHSQHSNRHLFTGAVWDALSFPALLPDTSPRTALVLGVAGGAVVHQLRRLCPCIQITGIELDPTHIDLARRYFDLEVSGVTLIHADAVAWVKRCRRRFDLVIDDLFDERLHRPVPADSAWQTHLCALTEQGGLLVQNHVGAAAATRAVAAASEAGFVSAATISVSQYQNRIALMSRVPIDFGAAKRRALARLPVAQTRKLRILCRRRF